MTHLFVKVNRQYSLRDRSLNWLKRKQQLVMRRDLEYKLKSSAQPQQELHGMATAQAQDRTNEENEGWQRPKDDESQRATENKGWRSTTGVREQRKVGLTAAAITDPLQWKWNFHHLTFTY